MSNKKKGKNSDYHYLDRKEEEKREARLQKEREKTKAKDRAIYIIAILLILGAVILGIYCSVTDNTAMAPIYTLISGVGIVMLGVYYKDRRETYSKFCWGFGVVMIVIAYLIYRGQVRG